MAHKRKRVFKRKANDGHARARNPLATRTHESRKAGDHGDKRKQASKQACRSKPLVD